LTSSESRAPTLAFVQHASKAVLSAHPGATTVRVTGRCISSSIDFQIAVWAYVDVYVASGGKLELDNTVNVLVAGRVTLESTAQIVANARFKIDCVTMQQN